MKRLLRRLLGVVALLIAAVLLFVFFPVMHKPFAHEIGPLPSYDEAVKEIRAGIAATPDTVSEAGIPLLMEHGRQTEYAIVLLHGLSNSPAQFSRLGQELYERGHNVYIPRMPYHGEKDRLTEDWGRLTAEQMLGSGNDAADVARGLGKKVIVAGLSVNGTTVAWMAQNRSDLHKVVVMAPFLAPSGLPLWSVRPLRNVLLRLPNMFFWWNPVLKENNPGPPYAYPRFPTRVIGETMLLGQTVISESEGHAPKSPSILVITTAIDRAANNAVTEKLVANWQRRHPVQTYQFPADQKIPHDFIDPNQPDQNVALVYPVLIELLEK